MRISVNFVERGTSKVPINQNYFLAGAVYNALSALARLCAATGAVPRADAD